MIRVQFYCLGEGNDSYLALSVDGIKPRHRVFIAVIDCADTDRLYMNDPVTACRTLVVKNYWEGVYNYSIHVFPDA